MSDTLDNDLKNLEAQLSQLSPSEMPANLLSRMENAMVSWETSLPVEEKIVPFTELRKEAQPSRSGFFTWGAAAAVALMAGVGFVLTSETEQPAGNTTVNQAGAPVIAKPIASNVIDAQPYKKNLVNASNEGIMYAGEDKTPYQVTHLYYLEEVEFTDAQGNKKKVVQPTVEKHLTPVPVN